MWQSLHDAWWRLATERRPQSFLDALACSALHTGSMAYRGAVGLRNLAYDRGWARQVRLPCRVVSVGNLTVGGTGKTACVELIARKLAGAGRHVAVLSRGYGGARRTYALQWAAGRLTVDGRPDGEADGLADEPQLLARHLEGIPVLVGARRDLTGRVACTEFHADALVLDDGFQHRRLHRDCEIVLVNARMPLGGWKLLPRGPMREPLTSLRRAHVVVVTKADEALELLAALGERLQALNPDAAIVSAVHAPTAVLDAAAGAQRSPAELEGKRVALVSSIGDPSGFEATVRRLHAAVLWHRAFPDHHRYRAGDWQVLAGQAQATRPDALLTTEKDWVRLAPLVRRGDRPAVPLWILRVEMQLLEGADALDARLAGLDAR